MARKASGLLEGDGEKAEKVSGVRLGSILDKQRELRLVVLNACEGAAPLANDPFGGLAQALVGAGIPADGHAIAHQGRLGDQARGELL